MKENLLNRKTYKAIKKYDRQEMERFVATVYSEGFQDGAESAEGADFKIKLVQLLRDTKGVGPKTTEKILDTLKIWEELNEEVKNLAVLNKEEE